MLQFDDFAQDGTGRGGTDTPIFLLKLLISLPGGLLHHHLEVYQVQQREIIFVAVLKYNRNNARLYIR